MGCDGGTIPTRDELVRVKKKPEQKDKDSVRAFKWKHCAISQEPLRPPVVACELGSLYSKESLLELLLDRSKFQGSARFDHIRGLKDVKTLQLTPNPAFCGAESDKGGVYIDRNTAQYICPITGLEMSGKYRFCYLNNCGCVFAERALKEIKTDTCTKCGQPYSKNDYTILNGTDEEVEVLRTRMQERREKAKLEKKSKKKRKAEAVEASGSGDPSSGEKSPEEGPSASKQSKAADSDETDHSGEASGSSSSKLTNGSAASSKLANGSSASSKLANGSSSSSSGGARPKTSTDKSLGKEKTYKSIQKDPSASAAYKSLFTSCEKAKNQPKGHWVTHNPQYY